MMNLNQKPPALHIIFDLDGTLFQTDSVTVPATLQALAEFGLEAIPASRISSMIGASCSEFVATLFPNLTADERIALGERIGNHEKRMIVSHGRLYPEIEGLLSALADTGATLVILTAGSVTYATMVLGAFDLLDSFTEILSCAGRHNKSEVLTEYLNGRSVTGFVVGDRAGDLNAAHANGCVSVGASYGYGGDEVDAADIVAATPTEVLSAILTQHIYLQIEQMIHDRKLDSPFILGINGVDLSGKTTFTGNLAKWLRGRKYDVQGINLDDFHSPSAKRREGPDPITAYLENAFDLTTLERELLQPIREEGCVEKELVLLDLDSDEFTNRQSYQVNSDTIVLLEGVLLFRDPLDRYLSGRVFIDISFEEVLHRAHIRDVPRFGEGIIDSYRNKYIPLQKRYLEEFSPSQNADLVIDNNDPLKPRLAK